MRYLVVVEEGPTSFGRGHWKCAWNGTLQPEMKLRLVANGMAAAEIVADLPNLDVEGIRQALAYAAVLAEDQLHPLHA